MSNLPVTNTEMFIEKSNKTHNNFYVYDWSDYKGSTRLVTIICRKHGTFNQRAGKHHTQNGCPICANEKNGQRSALTKQEFVERAKAVYGNSYIYTNVKYKNSSTKVDIICGKCGGMISITPNSFLKGKTKCKLCK